MEALLELLKDGKSRSTEMIAEELGLSVSQVKRSILYLEQMNMIRRIDLSSAGGSSCAGCSGCNTGSATCSGCVPEGGFQNMGIMWEVVDSVF